jgi:hypothetical protein
MEHTNSGANSIREISAPPPIFLVAFCPGDFSTKLNFKDITKKFKKVIKIFG